MNQGLTEYQCRCGNDIDFSSEGITFDYDEDIDGNIFYTCYECLQEILEMARSYET